METLGLYDKNGIYLKENVDRKNKLSIPKEKYYKIVIVFIINNKGQFLIQKASDKKGGIYETLGGHVKDKCSSKETIIEELNEELSINIEQQEITFFKKYTYNQCIQEVYFIRKDIDINKLIYQEDEVSFAIWLSIEEIKKIIASNNFRIKNIIPFLELIKYLEVQINE